MQLKDFFMLLGGLALFLYGMKMMSQGLEVAAGDKLKDILERLTKHRIMGILVGAGITALVQSSSATTVMVVGFVNTGLMSLNQAVWIIMGANIGTTITSQLIALDMGEIAPLFAIVGVVMVTFFKNKKWNCIGEIIAGLGILFMGMSFMSDAMVPLRDEPMFIELMSTFTNPLLAILLGAGFTALIQSSAASIGILQKLASTGAVSLQTSAFILFGQNIGTCITSFFASLGANRNAKRTTLMHFLFNIIGTIVFVIICLILPFTDWIAQITPDKIETQIANIHTIFNVVTTLLLIPFGNLLVKVSVLVIPEKAEEKETVPQLSFIDDSNIGSTTIAISLLEQELSRMLKAATDNVELTMDAVIHSDDSKLEIVNKNENLIDYINIEITRFMSRVTSLDLQRNDAARVTALYKMSNDLERIGDHAQNIIECVTTIKKHSRGLSKEAVNEIVQMKEMVVESMVKLQNKEIYSKEKYLENIVQMERDIDTLNYQFRRNQLERLVKEKCSAESVVVYSELLTDVERISDLIRNVAELCAKYELILTY